MNFDVKEIVAAWAAKIHPTEDQKALAVQRAEICATCPDVGTILGDNFESIRYCKNCGCFIGAKIYSYKEGACPKGKWDSLDANFLNTKAIKVSKDKSSKLV